MKYLIFALALSAYAQSMPPPSSNASTLRGKQPCPTTASTNCIPLVDSSGNISVPGSISAGSTGAIDLTAITAPATPAAGIGSVFVDSTSKNLAVKDDAGVVKHGVQTKAAVTNQLVSAIADDGTVTTRSIAAADLPANIKKRSFGATFDGGGSALTARTSPVGVIPFACTISAWNIMTDAGTATINVWKVGTGTAIPTVSNNINTSGVALAANTAIHSTTLTDFGANTAVTAGDMYRIDLTTVATATMVTVSVECDQ